MKPSRISETMEKSLKIIKKSMKTIQTSLKTMGKWMKAKMLQIPCKFTILALQICDFSSKMQQIASKSEILAPKRSK